MIHLESKLKGIEVNKKQAKNGKETFECRKCPDVFESKKSLRKHVFELHPMKIKCMICDSTFESNCDLELHIREVHEKEKQFHCEHCEKMFVTEWRLKKHNKCHLSEVKMKKCHYFNNQKACPYEDLGCMFLHEVSEKCTFMESCSNSLCSFQHSNESDPKATIDEETMDENEDIGENQCHLCMLQLKTKDELMEHYRLQHLQFYTWMTSRSINPQ